MYVCDHHNYALPFILEKSKQLKLNKLQTLIHADAHSDAFKNDKFNSTLYAKKFSKKQANKEKMEYFYSNTRINDWMISPLTQNNHIELNNWRWLNIVEKNKQPTLKATDYKNYLMGTNRFFNLSKFQNLDSAEIFDLDIDILTIPDNNLTEEEKSDILKGTIPNQILSFLRELAKLCNSAKIVTIATSPGFINQERAIIYVKKFLELI